MKTLLQSLLLIGPSGAGKSSFARHALESEGSGIIAASPPDELDSYLGLDGPAYAKMGFDDSSYLPSIGVKSPTGLQEMVKWLYGRLAEVNTDVKEGKAPRYSVVVIDTLSAIGQLATNATLVKFNLTEAPPAMSPDGAAFYTNLRGRQEELMRIVRAFKGFGLHIIGLSHVGESEVGDTAVAKVAEGRSRIHTPLVPGAFKLALPGYFSTVFYAGVARGIEGKRVHYVQWKPDDRRPTKSRFGALESADKIVLPNNSAEDWRLVQRLIEQAAAKLAIAGEPK